MTDPDSLTEGSECVVIVLEQYYRGKILSVDGYCMLPVRVQYETEHGSRIERFAADEVFVSQQYTPSPSSWQFGLTPTLERARFRSSVPAILKDMNAQAQH